VNLKALHTTNCLNVFFKSIPQQSGSLLWIEVDHKNGMGLSLIVDNPEQKSISIETKFNNNSSFNSIIVPPTSPYLYFGYGVHIRNESPGSTTTQNIIKNISAYYMPYSWMKAIRFESGLNKYINISDTCTHKGIFQYICILFNNGINKNEILYISQSYNKGWKAYYVNDDGWLNTNLPFLFGTELKEHVLVNNWANGWLLSPPNRRTKEPEGNKIVIVFLPQYLEYLGFALLGTTLTVIIFWKKKNKASH